MGKKANAAQIEQRVTAVHGKLLQCLPRAQIIQEGIKEWNVQQRTIDGYIATASARIKQSAAFDRDEELALAIHQLKGKLPDAVKVQDFVAVRRELSLLLGLHAPAKQSIALEGMDTALLERLISAAAASGKDVGTLLNLLIQQLEKAGTKP